MAARGWGLFSLYIEKCKNHLVPNHSTDFHIILQKCSFGDPLPRLFKPFGFAKKTWPPGGRAYFPYICIYIENFKKSSCQKPMDRFQYNLEGMCLWSPSSKVVQAVMIRQKIWLQGVGAYFPLYIYIENLKKYLLVRNHWTDFSITWQKCFLGDPLPRLFRPWFVKKHGC